MRGMPNMPKAKMHMQSGCRKNQGMVRLLPVGVAFDPERVELLR